MATRGFEFYGNLDGGQQGPVIRDWPCNAIDAEIGAVLVVDSNGELGLGTASVTEVTAILMEDTVGTLVDGTNRKVAIVNDRQIWKVSMDATSTAAKKGYDKTIDVASAYKVDADDLSNGRMCLWDTGTDDDGNVLAYVQFQRPTFGASAS